MSIPPPVKDKNTSSLFWQDFFYQMYVGVKRAEDAEILLYTSFDKRGGELEKRVKELEKILFLPKNNNGELKKRLDKIELLASLPDSKTIRIQHNISDASESHTITDPADAPATADALRDDLVANAIPDIESALDAIGTILNEILKVLKK